MVSYRPPKGKNVLFDFTEEGYTPPDFVNIDFLAAAYSTSDLQAYIEIMQFYEHGTADLEASLEVWPLFQDSTYTYVKSCRQVVVGYSDTGVQVLELPCLFGGIRDLGAFITTGKLWYSSYTDLYADIIGDTDIFFDLPAGIKALRHSYADILSVVQTIPAVDLHAFFNIIETRDITASISGTLFKGNLDLAATFGKVTIKSNKNLNSYITSWHISDLAAMIGAFSTADLQATIFSGYFRVSKNLSAYLACVAPVDLQATLHGYAKADLNAITIVGYQPYDLPSSIRAVRPRDLPAYVYGMKAQDMFFDLPANIQGFSTRDIAAYITSIGSASFLAYIVATGKYLDLLAEIVPKTINIKRIISISLFEHKDLRAVVNYNCLKSSFVDLPAYLYTIKRLDLSAFIIGWYGGAADNVIDLAAYINAADYVQANYTSITSNVYDATPPFVTFGIHSTPKKGSHKVLDTLMLLGNRSTNILRATITGILYSRDISAQITAKPLANFTTVPNWVNPKTLEVVINLDRFGERWRRFVEMMFFTNSDEDYHFFYVPNENKVYKVNRERTWKVQVLGFSNDPNKLNSRIKVKKLFVFNLKNYDTFDQALNDLIDRVATRRHRDLEVSIIATTFPSTDLQANIKVKRINHWSLSCKATITGILNNFKLLDAYITPKLYKDTNNLTALIVGKAYEAPTATNIHFKFDDPTYVSPGSYNNMNWTHIQAEDFWKE